MPRANRHDLPRYIWHITHRCHEKELLLQLARDRRAWMGGLFEAKKRYGLSVLTDTVTSNHIHRLVVGGKEAETIPNSLQLMAGRTAQPYNQCKQRWGAVWEDRDQATAVESGEHVIQCLVYIELNMVRVGVVGHPEEWLFGGSRKIENPKQRYGIIDHPRWIELLGMKSLAGVQESRIGRVEAALRREQPCRQAQWTESIAVGSEQYVGAIKRELGVMAKGRKVTEAGGSHQLRESGTAYRCQYEDD